MTLVKHSRNLIHLIRRVSLCPEVNKHIVHSIFEHVNSNNEVLELNLQRAVH